MDSSIKISVVVCAFNEEKQLKNCLLSIKNQTLNHKNYELIIMDNNSQDNTFNVAVNFLKNTSTLLVKVLRIEHVCLSGSRNTALDYCQGDIIVYMDADACADSSWLEHLIKPFIDKNIDIVSGTVKNLIQGNNFSEFIYRAYSKPAIDSNIDNEDVSKLIGANMALRKEVFDIVRFHDNSQYSSRGDETLLSEFYFSRVKRRKIAHAKNAIVYNEFASSLPMWLKQQYHEGKSGYMVQSLISSRKFKKLCQTLGKIINVLALPAILVLLFFVHCYLKIALPLIVMFLCLNILRQLPKMKYYRRGILYVSKYFSKRFALLVIPTCWIGSVFADFGYIVSIFTMRTHAEKKLTPTKESKILSCINSEGLD
jgi:glycosyltransferase involved in cell wall biosynthesis